MYCEYYGFREKPFAITPNPRFIFLSKQHQEAFAHLMYGINNHAGFIELTGEVGTGKTTVLRTLLEQLHDEQHRVALIFNPCLSAVELLRSINREFAIPYEDMGNEQLLSALYAFLLAENAAGRTVALIIDEAQNLQPQVLEQIRLISNLETNTDKLIQIVLTGQPELETLLRLPKLRQLDQRITVRFRLGSLDAEDTRRYIAHRLQVASGYRTVDFTPAAVFQIYMFTKGVPRLINILCDRTLLVAFTQDKREILPRHVAQAIKEVRRETKGFSRKAMVYAGMALVVVMLTLYWLIYRI
jgi:general secretion pathway protein A